MNFRTGPYLSVYYWVKKIDLIRMKETIKSYRFDQRNKCNIAIINNLFSFRFQMMNCVKLLVYKSICAHGKWPSTCIDASPFVLNYNIVVHAQTENRPETIRFERIEMGVKGDGNEKNRARKHSIHIVLGLCSKFGDFVVVHVHHLAHASASYIIHTFSKQNSKFKHLNFENENGNGMANRTHNCVLLL